MKVFLDFDGTLIDNKYKYYRIYKELCGPRVLSLEKYWSLKRDHTPEVDIAARTADSTTIDRYLSNRVAMLEQLEYLAEDRLYPETPKILDKMVRKHRIHLVSCRKSRKNLIWQLKDLKIHDFFHYIYNTGNDVDKNVYINYDIHDKTDCIIIGDTDTDINAGNALGIISVGVTNGIRSRDKIESYNPTHVFNGIGDKNLLNLLDIEYE